MKENIVQQEALKEVGRVLLFAIIPLAIASLESWTLDWKQFAIVGGVAVIRFIDKYLHETGKLIGDESLKKGLSRF